MVSRIVSIHDGLHGIRRVLDIGGRGGLDRLPSVSVVVELIAFLLPPPRSIYSPDGAPDGRTKPYFAEIPPEPRSSQRLYFQFPNFQSLPEGVSNERTG